MIISDNSTKTPTSNTGVIPTNKSSERYAYDLHYKLDWLSGTFPTKQLKKIIRYAEVLLGVGKFEQRPSGIKYFNQSYRHPSSSIVGTGRKLPGGYVDDTLSYIELTGKSLISLKQSKVRKFLKFLILKCQFKPTRIDLTIDDFSKQLPLDKIAKAAYRHQYTGFGNTPKIHESGILGTKGKTISLGNRGSKGGGKYIIFYDKDKETKGHIKSHRIELSCYDDYSMQSSLDLITHTIHEWGTIIHGWIIGAIDFRNRKNPTDKNPGRCPQPLWWRKFIKSVKSLKVSRVYHKPDIKKRIDWFQKQVAPTLALLINYFGYTDIDDWWLFFWTCVQDGESRFKDSHRYLLLQH